MRHVLPLLLVLALALSGCGLWKAREDARIRERVEAIHAAARAREPDRALALCEALQQDHPNRIEGWLAAGRIHHDLWQNPEAGKAFEAAYKLDPADFPALPELALVLALAGMPREQIVRLLATHRREYPHTPGLAEAQVLALGEALNGYIADADRRKRYEERLAALVERFRSSPRTTSAQLYHESEALMLLGRWDEAREAMRNGIEADTDRWHRLIMQMTLAYLLLHDGEQEQAFRLIREYVKLYASWEPFHFSQRMPMTEFLQVTWRARTGEPLPIPDQVATRREAARKAGVQVQFGVEDTLTTLQTVIRTLDEDDPDATLSAISDAVTLLVRDRGCVSETRVVKPAVVSSLMVIEGDIHQQHDRPQEASAAYHRALSTFPRDPWLLKKAGRPSEPPPRTNPHP